MRHSFVCTIMGLLLAGCAGDMGGKVARETGEPASCKKDGDAMKCHPQSDRFEGASE